MRKIYLLVLLAAALLIGTNAWATTYNKSVTTYDELIAAVEGGTDTYAAGDIVNITLNPAGNSIDFTLTGVPATHAYTGNGAGTHYEDAVNHMCEIYQGQTVNLDLNGKNINSEALMVFAIYYGKLNITGTGVISNNLYRYKTDGSSSACSEASVIWMAGINQANCDPQRCYLNVGPNVTLECNNGKCGIYVNQMKKADNGTTSTTYKNRTIQWSAISSGKNCAYGVYADVYGTVHGYRYGMQMSGNINKIDIPAPGNSPSLPTFYVHSNANVSAGYDATECCGIYLGGYCRVRVEGNVSGTTGVYAKSGILEIEDANIQSTSALDYSPAVGGTSGANAAGSAVVVESNKSYAGEIEVTISGDSELKGKQGYAIEEQVTTATQTNVSTITIEGGSFTGGDAGCIHFDDQTVAAAESTTPGQEDGTEITIVSGNYQGQTVNDENFNEVLSNTTGTEVQTITDPEDPTKVTTIVVVDPVAPSDRVNVSTNDIQDVYDAVAAHATDGKKVYVTFTAGTHNITSDLAVEKLDLSSGNAHINIQAGKKLTVGSIMMNVNAVIELFADDASVVEPKAGTLIITGKDGVYAPSVNNIILHASDAAQARLLFNPNVTTNRHPNATVEFVSRSYRNSSTEFVKQRFGIPTIGAVSSITATPVETAVAFQVLNYEAENWDVLGYLNSTNPSLPNLNPSDLNVPFASYLSYSNRLSSGTTPTTLTITGSLVGNASPEVALYHNAWIALSNSYTGDINLEQAVNAIYDNVPGIQAAIYVNVNMGVGSYTWKSVSKSDFLGDELFGNTAVMDKLNPMQPFIIKNLSSSDKVWSLDYNGMVWTPYITNAAPAPRRSQLTNVSAIQIAIEGNGTYDDVRMAACNEFSAEYENGYDVIKYMNDAMNLYVTDAERLSTLMTDNIEDTYLGFAANEAGLYTITFTTVRGNEYDLLDLATNTRVAITTGATYQFYANDNEANDYRFKVVERQEMPTDVEVVENSTVKPAGIYTVTGQYLGEMNVWNNLPAGIYIVNGEKMVK